jgi:predicted membrane protein
MMTQNSQYPAPHDRNWFPALIPGLVLVGLGMLFLLDNLHILYLREWVRFWPVILIAIGLAKVVDSAFAGGRTVGIIFMCVGAILLAKNFGLILVRVRDLWPIFLIGIGLFMLWHRLTPHPTWHDRQRSSSASVVSDHAVFGGGKRNVNTDDFQGGEVSAIFGGVELNLRRAVMKGESATLEVNTVFGGVEVTIPENWSAVVQGSGVFGGFSDSTVQPDPARTPDFRRIIVRGAAVFGGVNIKN